MVSSFVFLVLLFLHSGHLTRRNITTIGPGIVFTPSHRREIQSMWLHSKPSPSDLVSSLYGEAIASVRSFESTGPELCSGKSRRTVYFTTTGRSRSLQGLVKHSWAWPGEMCGSPVVPSNISSVDSPFLFLDNKADWSNNLNCNQEKSRNQLCPPSPASSAPSWLITDRICRRRRRLSYRPRSSEGNSKPYNILREWAWVSSDNGLLSQIDTYGIGPMRSTTSQRGNRAHEEHIIKNGSYVRLGTSPSSPLHVMGHLLALSEILIDKLGCYGGETRTTPMTRAFWPLPHGLHQSSITPNKTTTVSNSITVFGFTGLIMAHSFKASLENLDDGFRLEVGYRKFILRNRNLLANVSKCSRHHDSNLLLSVGVQFYKGNSAQSVGFQFYKAANRSLRHLVLPASSTCNGLTRRNQPLAENNAWPEAQIASLRCISGHKGQPHCVGIIGLFWLEKNLEQKPISRKHVPRRLHRLVSLKRVKNYGLTLRYQPHHTSPSPTFFFEKNVSKRSALKASRAKIVRSPSAVEELVLPEDLPVTIYDCNLLY